MQTLIGELWRFGLVGLAATGLHFAVLTLLVEQAGLPAPVANGAAFLVALTVTYAGQSCWVFRNRSRHGTRQILKFAVSLVIGLAANIMVMAVSTDIFGLDYRVGFLCGVILVPAISFVINRAWVFAPV